MTVETEVMHDILFVVVDKVMFLLLVAAVCRMVQLYIANIFQFVGLTLRVTLVSLLTYIVTILIF